MTSFYKSDLYRYYGRTSYRYFVKAWLREPGFRFLFYFRLVKKLTKISPLSIIGKYLLRRCSYRFGIQIPHDTSIGEGFYIGHFGCIVINKRAILGKNINITNGVTIGQANRGKLKGVPTLGDYVWIGANATIVGNIKIGNDVLIAPGAYVNFDVPDHSIVIGNPGVIKFRENATAEYIKRTI
jgi:serine O-acetyltransferase